MMVGMAEPNVPPEVLEAAAHVYRHFDAARSYINRRMPRAPYSMEVVVSPMDRFMQGPTRAMLVVRLVPVERVGTTHRDDRFLLMDSDAGDVSKWDADFDTWLRMIEPQLR